MNMKWMVVMWMVLSAGAGWGQVSIDLPDETQDEWSGDVIGEDGPGGAEEDGVLEDPVESGDEVDDPADLDGDGIPDDSDPDADGNGIADEEEIGESDPGDADLDEDGIPDEFDPDADGDGIEDIVDPDDDGDDIPDVVDPDVGDVEYDRDIVYATGEEGIPVPSSELVGSTGSGKNAPEYLDRLQSGIRARVQDLRGQE